MRTIPVALLALLLVGCGAEGAPRATAPAPSATAAAQLVEPGRQIEPVDEVATAPPRPQVIPDDFPLADAYPADGEFDSGPGLGVERPNRTSPAMGLAPCDHAIPLPEHTDLLRAGWSGPEDWRARQLATFADPSDAAAYVDTVVASHEACPERLEADGESGSRNTVTETGLGDQGSAVSTQYTIDGVITPGLTTLHLVRVRSAVLLSVTSNEGGGGPDPRAAMIGQVADGADAIAAIVDAMHRL